MTISIRKLLTTLFILFLFVSIIACGSEGDDGGNESGNQTPAADLSGTWNIEETENGDCAGSIYPKYESYTATVTQTGNDFSMTYTRDDETYKVNGTISGSAVAWEDTIADAESTTSIAFSGTVSDDGNTITGSSTWTWTDGSYSCSGTADITAERATESSVDVTGSWSGTWESSVMSSLSGFFSTNITQQDSTLSGTIDVPGIVSDATLKGTIEGAIITFGDIDDKITFTGTVSEDSTTSSGTYDYPTYDDGTWQGTKS